MLRVGLTGGLGSGKSTVAAMLHAHGAHTLSSDEIARDLMQPGRPVYAAIVNTFGAIVVQPTGALDRSALARLAFREGHLDQLNALVHPAVIAEQARLLRAIEAEDPDAIAVVESALLFETPHAGPGGWRKRFDCIVLVTAPDAIKIERFVQRVLRSDPAADPDRLRTEAQRRLRHQLPDAEKAPQSDVALDNSGSVDQLQARVDELWKQLTLAKAIPERTA